jgi:hypothetical protein
MKMVPASNPDDHNPLDDLDEAVGRDSEIWDKEKEPKVSGRVIELGEFIGEYEPAQVVVLLTRDNREVHVRAFGDVLRREIGSRNLEPGDLFAVRYLAPVMGKRGKEYHSYRIVHRGPDGSPKNTRTEGRQVLPPPEFADVDDPENDEEPF